MSDDWTQADETNATLLATQIFVRAVTAIESDACGDFGLMNFHRDGIGEPYAERALSLGRDFVRAQKRMVKCDHDEEEDLVEEKEEG